MSLGDSALIEPARNFKRSATSEWETLSYKIQIRCKVGALVVMVTLAYHYSLTSLLQTITLDTPLAYLGLVPIIAAGLAWVNRNPQASEPPIHDRQLDYTLGLPLVFLAVLGGVVLPGRMGDMFWINRIDLLLMPVYVIGSTILLFGVRVAWRQKIALGYLFLGWPWLYSTLLLGTLGGFTTLTLKGVNASLKVFHVARQVAGGNGLYEVVHDGKAFPISVISACSGIDGMVGFFLIGVALASIVSGSIIKKALWLIVGMSLLWVTNLGRLLGIFWIGEKAGSDIALNVVHPVAGLVMFCFGVGVMGALMRPFGLNRTFTQRVVPSNQGEGKSAAPKIYSVITILLIAAITLSVSNSALKSYDLVANATGEPKLASFLADPAEPAGWTATFETEFTQSKALFGSNSRWFRYLYLLTKPADATLQSSLPVTADIIDAGSLEGFNAYGVTACYSFHGYILRDVSNVNLGKGIEGQTLSYSGGSAVKNWSIVYWIVPVETGGGIRYERVILYVQNTKDSTVSINPKAPGARQLESSLEGADSSEQVLIKDQAFLVEFARQVIAGQTHQDDTGVFISSVVGEGAFAPGTRALSKGEILGEAGGKPDEILTPIQAHNMFEVVLQRQLAGESLSGSVTGDGAH